jgi:hypothetical protein
VTADRERGTVTTTTKTAQATTKKGLTLDELREWVMDAKQAGIPGATAVIATIGFGGRIKKIEVRG